MIFNLIAAIINGLQYFGVFSFPDWIKYVSFGLMAIGLIESIVCITQGKFLAVVEAIGGLGFLVANIFFIINLYFC